MVINLGLLGSNLYQSSLICTYLNSFSVSGFDVFVISKLKFLDISNFMKSTSDHLLEKYGPLMTIEQLAQVLSRKGSGLRGVLQKPTEPWMFELNRVKRRIGRRIYFPTDAVAALLRGDFDGGSNGMESLSDRPEIGKVFGICSE